MLPALLSLFSLTAVLAGLSFFIAHRILTGNRRVPLTVRPEDFSLAYESVTCRTIDGLALKGWFIPATEPSSRTLLFFHGWSTNKGEILRFTYPLAARGFNLLYFDTRACGESEGTMLSVGYLENRDFDAAADFLKSLRPNDSHGVFGLSMGAMISFCGVTRHDGFRAAVLESPFRSHDLAVRHYLNAKYGIPYFPLIPLVLRWLKLRMGGDPEEFAPLRVAAKFETPLLAITGADDRMSAPEMVDVLLGKLSGHKEHWVVPGAGHALCAATAGPEYTERLVRFYRAHMP